MEPRQDTDAIAFGEKLLTLLDEGSYTATYKYAVLLALIDLCLLHSTDSGAAPTTVTTPQLAERVIELYWPHATPFPGPTGARVLRQNTTGQAEIITLIRAFRERTESSAPTLARARLLDPAGYDRLLREIEFKLIEMPLPRLQRIGATEDPFIYRIGWDTNVTASQVRSPDFDNRIHLLGTAGEHLVRLAGLIRPLVQRQWAAMVAQINRELVEDARLEEFLFGAERISLQAVHEPLRDVQSGRCFYCEAGLREPGEVDHFLPWARFPDNSIENLVVAHRRCNASKKAFLAATPHVEHWTERLEQADLLGEVATGATWETSPDRARSVVRAIYLRLPDDSKLWLRGREFVDLDRPRLITALGRERSP